MVLTINTENLILRNISNKDIDSLKAILLDKEVSDTYMVPDFKSHDEVDSLAKRIIDISNDDNRFLFGVYYKDTLIGFINEVNSDKKTIELGYVIDPKYKNQGYATETLKAAIEYLLNHGFSKIVCGAFIRNKASIRVMEKASLKKENNKEVIEYHGKSEEIVYYSMSK